MEIEKKETKLETAFVAEPEKEVSLIDRLSAESEGELFIENLSLLLASGMDTVSALSALQKEAKSWGMKAVIGQITRGVESGTSLSESIEKTGLFGTHVTALIKVGEESGKLSENMRTTAVQMQKDRAFRGKIASAMMYPVLVLTLTIIIGVSISWLILPRLANVFSQLRITLPWITQFLIDAGIFLSRYGAIFVPGVIVLVLLVVYFLFVNRKTKFIGQEILFSFPGIRELVAEVELSRFGFMLGNMLAAGLPVVTAFDSLIEVTEFRSYRKLYLFLRDRIEEGNSFAKSFAAYQGIDKLIPASIQQMIAAAEQSGFLAETLVKMGERYEAKTETTTKNISTVLEPILLIAVWFAVAAVALAIILPIYSLIGGFTQSGRPVETVVTPTPTPTALPTPTPVVKQIRVNETGIGYLNIRQRASTASPIIGRALPGETYVFVARTGEWYEILIPEDGSGFVNATYVEELP